MKWHLSLSSLSTIYRDAGYLHYVVLSLVPASFQTPVFQAGKADLLVDLNTILHGEEHISFEQL